MATKTVKTPQRPIATTPKYRVLAADGIFPRIVGVCLEYVYMPCMAYTRLSQVPDYAKLLPQTLLSA